MFRETHCKLADEDTDTKVIIITGSGEKAFVAGADISEFSNYDSEEGAALSKEGQDLLFDFIENLSTPSLVMMKVMVLLVKSSFQ